MVIQNLALAEHYPAMKPAHSAMEICKVGGIRLDGGYGGSTIEGEIEQGVVAAYSGFILIQAVL